MWRVSKSEDPDQTLRRRCGGWSWSTLFAYVRRSLFAWRWPYGLSTAGNRVERVKHVLFLNTGHFREVQTLFTKLGLECCVFYSVNQILHFCYKANKCHYEPRVTSFLAHLFCEKSEQLRSLNCWLWCWQSLVNILTLLPHVKCIWPGSSEKGPSDLTHSEDPDQPLMMLKTAICIVIKLFTQQEI